MTRCQRSCVSRACREALGRDGGRGPGERCARAVVKQILALTGVWSAKRMVALQLSAGAYCHESGGLRARTLSRPRQGSF